MMTNLENSSTPSLVGAKICKQQTSRYAAANSSLALRLQSNEQPIRISVHEYTKFILGTVCLGTDQFGREDQVKLLIRFVDENDPPSGGGEGWSCLCNYLGIDRGGQALPVITPLGFEVIGRCNFELCARGTDSACVDVACNVLSTSPPRNCDDADLQHLRHEHPDKQALRPRRELARLLKHLPFAALLILTYVNQIGGGLTQSSPSLNPTRRVTDNKRFESSEDSHDYSPKMSPSLPIDAKQATTTDQAVVSAPSNDTMTESRDLPATNLFDEEEVATTSTSVQNECIDITIAFLPSWIDDMYPVEWSFSSTTGAAWNKSYSSVKLFNDIIIDHTADDDTCIIPGSYDFNITASGEAHYIVYSGGNVYRCGGLLKNGHAFGIDLPLDSSNIDSACSALIDCNGSDVDECLKQAFLPLQCYNNGTEVDVTAAEYHSGGNRSMWFSDTCSVALDKVCQSGALGFGIGNETAAVHRSENFCPYFQCASSAFISHVTNGVALDDFYGCECKYTQWTCSRSGGKCEYQTCCLDNGADDAPKDLSTACTCRIEPDCDVGNTEMCDVALDYCCPSKENDLERNECEKKFSRIKCETSVAQKGVDANGQYSYCKQNVETFCDGHADTVGCQCKYWEDLCNEYPEEAICEDAVDYCCPGSAVYMSWCYCDFYSWASTVGYKSEKMAGWCSTSETYLSQRSSVANDIFGLELIYNSLGGEFWYDSSDWLTATPHCEWYGVGCSDDRVSFIKLDSNNLTGDLSLFGEYLDYGGDTGSLFELQELDVSNNFISGSFESSWFFRHRTLLKVDVSNNQLTGIADILVSPSIIEANFSYNRLGSLGAIVRSKSAYNSLETVDLGHNLIEHGASSFLNDLPPNTKRIIVNDNFLNGTLPLQLPLFTQMEVFDMSYNSLSGTVPDFSRSMPRVLKLHLAGQNIKGTGGLSGSLPHALSSLLDLLDLDLSSNKLTGNIPPSIGNIPRLKILNLSKNELTGLIDKELAKLSGVSEVFDVSENKLFGSIPEDMKYFTEGLIFLGDNDDLLGLAPLGLCYNSAGFDLKDDPAYCPLERNALKDFFDAAKGREWTNSFGWDEQFLDFCEWHGVTCSNETRKPVGLNLGSNGLSGTFSETFGTLSTLEIIDLSDNDIKGSIPPNIGDFENLRTLRLSYNQFISSIPSQLSKLRNLELAHFQSNRLTGEVILNSQFMLEESSFIADCGVPTDFESVLKCDNCTMCCNINGGCHTTNEPLVVLNRFEFNEILGIILASVTGLIFVVTMLKCIVYNQYFKPSIDRTISRRTIVIEKQEAFETIGKDSVYCFFLTKSVLGWFIALLVLAFQFYVFHYFVLAAEKDFSDDKSDFTYSWRCPRNSDECNYLADQTPMGWFTFGVLMLSHLAKDIVQGMKLIYMSTKKWHHTLRRIRFFVGGVLMILITITALYASTVYNYAIARSNAELVENAVIVLYLVDVDEQLYNLMEVSCPSLLEKITGISQSKDEPDLNLDLSEVSPAHTRKYDNLRWSQPDRQHLSFASESFEDNKQYTGEPVDHSADISNIYAKLHQLESVQSNGNNNNKDVVNLYTKLHALELELTEVSKSNAVNSSGSGNNDALYQAQNEQRSQLASLERKIDGLCLALQVHKSSAEMMTDTMRHLYERTSEIEEELSQNSRQHESHIL